MHICEIIEEVEYTKKKYGLAPIELLNKYNLLNENTLIGIENGIPYIYCGTLQTHIRLGVIHEYFPSLVSKIDKEKMNRPKEQIDALVEFQERFFEYEIIEEVQNIKDEGEER